MTSAPPIAPASRFAAANRWWGLAGGLVLAASDTAMVRWLGFEVLVNGRDATLVLGAFFGSSFALLGFLVGWLLEARRHEREQAATLAALRGNLAQSEKLAALGQLASAIAHEVRNPLAVIRSAAQDFGEDPGPATRACQFIVDETDRLSHVVNALLAFARPVTVAPRPTAIRAVCDRALLLAQDELEAKSVRVVRGATSDAVVQADPDLLCQVLIGLLSNAADAAGTGGDVALDARVVDGAVELAVADSGPGIPPELRERVFEPFFTTRARGTGLGLAVARQIVEAHGGSIRVGDRAGGGACFTVLVPA